MYNMSNADVSDAIASDVVETKERGMDKVILGKLGVTVNTF